MNSLNDLNIKVITIPSSNFSRIQTNMESCGIKNYEILTYTPAKKTDNVGMKNLSVFDILEYNNVDSTSRNITRNHILTMEKCIRDGLKYAMITEDDIRFSCTSEDEKIRRITAWMNTHQWDIMYFGHCPWPVLFSTFETTDIVKVKTPLLAHCYLITTKAMKKIIRLYARKKSITIERLLLKANLKMYAVFPSIAHQIDPPGLYTRAMNKLRFPVHHNTLFTALEYTAVVIPYMGFLILLSIVFLKIKKVYKEMFYVLK
jgi:hypothetical protein